jgi:opacity protein-like surface antigen
MALTIAVILLSAGAAARAAAQDADPFERRGWHLELGGRGALEAWNYNISHEELVGISAGFTYGLRDGLVFTAGWPLTYVSQRGVDALIMGGTFGVRGRIYRRPRWSLFAGGEVGVSDADTNVPPRGTHFNYLAIGTVGVTIRLRRDSGAARPAGPNGLYLLAGAEVIHVSNGGFAGRDRNPDIEAIGPRIGLLLAF